MFFVEILSEGSGQGLEEALRFTLVQRRRVVDPGKYGTEGVQ